MTYIFVHASFIRDLSSTAGSVFVRGNSLQGARETEEYAAAAAARARRLL